MSTVRPKVPMMSDDLAWMPMFWGDYLKDTTHLSTAEHGAYLLLIAHYWVTRSPLPSDDERLRRIARMEKSEWRKSRDAVLAFFIEADDGWHQGRIEEELGKWSNLREMRRDRAGKAASARWAKHDASPENASSNATSMREALPQASGMSGAAGGVRRKKSEKREKNSENELNSIGQKSGEISTQPIDFPRNGDATSMAGALLEQCPPPSPIILHIDPDSPDREGEGKNESENRVAFAPPAHDEIGQAVRDWNDLADEVGLPAVRAVTDARRQALRRRLSEVGGIDGWRMALGQVRGSAFLRGENDRGWRADIDFLLKAKSFTRLIEGAYADRPDAKARASPQSSLMDAVDRVCGVNRAAPRDMGPVIEMEAER